MTTISTSDEKEKESNLAMFQKRRDIRSNTRRLQIESWHYAFLRKFFRSHKNLFIYLLLILIAQVFLEVGLFVYGRFIDGFLSARLNIILGRELLGILLLGAIIYLVAAFAYLWIEKSILVKLINEMRERWFSVGLYRQASKTTSFERARLVAKLTYHFSLVQAGFSSAFSGFLRWNINNLILLIFCFFIDSAALVQVLISIPVGVGLGIIGYIIGKYYLSREASLSTAIITHIAQALDKVGLLQNHVREKESLFELNKMVILDSQLKIRRNLWMEFGFRIIFVLFVLGGALVTYVVLFVPQINLEQYVPTKTIISGLILVYLMRQIYLSLRVGLFLVPLKIGLALSLPGPETLYIRKNTLKLRKTIEFYSSKVKLTPNNNYIHDPKLSFEVGKSYLIYGDNQVGKTALSLVLSGNATSSGNPWLIRMDGRRRRYKQWCLMYRGAYYVPVISLGSATIGEVIAARDGLGINDELVRKIGKIIDLPALEFIKRLPKYISTQADNKAVTSTEKHLIQLASCLLNKPQIVVIDNIVMDNKDPRVIEMIQTVCRELTNSVIICLAANKNNYLVYEKIYHLESSALLEE